MPDDEKVEHAQGWSLAQVWNESMEKAEDRVYEPRDYMYASELGKLYSDVYLKMKGTIPTNPPNARSLRKFEAGNLWEWLIKIILLRAGILIETQKRVRSEYPDMIHVSGKLDFYAGGKPNYADAQKAIEELYLPEKTKMAMENIVKYLVEKYPDGLESKVLEIKSCSSFMMNALEISKQPLDIHALQAYHYTKDPEIGRADVIYICRDDCRMMEFSIMADTEKYEQKYVAYLKQITEYYRSDVMPPKEEPIIFSEVEGKFSVNRPIGWSPYLTMVYGLKDQLEFDEKYNSFPASWNRVLKRIKNGDKMTANNEQKIAEMREHGWNPEELATKLLDINEEEENADIS